MAPYPEPLAVDGLDINRSATSANQSRYGKLLARWNTTRRAETTTRAATFSNFSRIVPTWASPSSVPPNASRRNA